MNPEISVIIPAYNAEQTLNRCLESVFSQDFDALEVILVNDGSRDRTYDVAREYSSCLNFVLIDQPNAGVAKARWEGIVASRGKYLSFVDADDYVAPEMMRKMHAKAESTGAQIVVCAWNRVCGDISFPCAPSYAGLAWERGVRAVERRIIREGNGSLWGQLFRKDTIDESSYKKTFGIRLGEDLLLSAMLMAKAEKVAYLEEALYFYVQNPDSVTGNPKISSLEDLPKVFSMLFDFFSASGDAGLQRKAALFYAQGLIGSLRRVNSLPNSSEVEKVRKDILQKLFSVPLSSIKGPGRFRLLFDLFLIRMRLFRFICFLPGAMLTVRKSIILYMIKPALIKLGVFERVKILLHQMKKRFY